MTDVGWTAAGREGMRSAVALGRRAATSRTAILTVASGAVSAFGLLRELVAAARFGLTPAADAFAVSVFVYETAYNVLLTGLGFALVPAVSRYLRVRDMESAADVATAAWAAVAGATASVGVWILLVPQQAFGVLLGGSPTLPEATMLFRSVGVGLVFASVSGVLAAVLNAHELYLTPVTARLLFTASVVVALQVSPAERALEAAAAGLLVGVLLQWLVSAVRVPDRAAFALRAGRRVTAAERRATAVAGLLGLGTFLVWNTGLGSIERSLLARTGPGDVAAASLAQRSTALLALVATAMQTVAFSRIARQGPVGAMAAAATTLRRGAVVLLPSLVLLMLFALPVVRMLFERGQFGTSESLRTAELLRWYCASVLPGFAFGVLLRFVASADRWSVALTSTLLMSAAATAVDLALLRDLGAVAIPIGNTIGASVGCVVCIAGMRPPAPAAR